MQGSFAEFRRLWSNDTVVYVAVIVALVLTGLDVFWSTVYVLIGLLVDRDFPFGWTFYFGSFIRSLIVFVVVLLITAFVLGRVHRRRLRIAPSSEP